MSGLVVYIIVFLLVFFAASFATARWDPYHDPTEPDTFLLLVGVALVWPITVLLAMAFFLLVGIATLANKLAGDMKWTLDRR